MAVAPSYLSSLYDYRDPLTGDIRRCSLDEYNYRKQRELEYYMLRAKSDARMYPSESALSGFREPKQATPQPNPVLLLGE